MISKIGLYLGATAVLCLALWYGYHRIEQSGYDRCLTETQAANLKLAITYANQIVKAEGERDANQTIIDRLVIESRSLHVHFPVCPATDAQNPDGTAGLASARIDQYMAEAKSEIDAIGERCAKLNADAIKVNAVSY